MSQRKNLMHSSDIFERNYQQYCDQLTKIDFESVRDILGIVHDNDGKMCIPFFNKKYFVSKNGIMDIFGNRADYVVSVILAKYILLCPDKIYFNAEWASSKDFKSTSHFTIADNFSEDTDKIIEKYFAGRPDSLKKACTSFGGSQYEMDISYDLSVKFNALPRISLLLLFNDDDNEFPAKCNVLFHKHAEHYLDPESLVMTRVYLVKNLKKIFENGRDKR